MKSVLLLIGLILCLNGFAQQLGTYESSANLELMLRDAPYELLSKKGAAYGTIGTPYFFEEFQTGNIYLANKTVYNNIPINYDCYNEQVHFSKGEMKYILNKKMIDYLEFPGNKNNAIVFKQVFVKEKAKTLFMKLLYEKKSSLYKYVYKSFQEADYTGAYSQDKRYDEYIENHAWYIDLGDNELQRFRSKKNVILKLMDPYSKEIEKFLKKEKPDLKTEEGLVLVVEYYDELLAGKED